MPKQSSQNIIIEHFDYFEQNGNLRIVIRVEDRGYLKRSGKRVSKNDKRGN